MAYMDTGRPGGALRGIGDSQTITGALAQRARMEQLARMRFLGTGRPGGEPRGIGDPQTITGQLAQQGRLGQFGALPSPPSPLGIGSGQYSALADRFQDPSAMSPAALQQGMYLDQMAAQGTAAPANASMNPALAQAMASGQIRTAAPQALLGFGQQEAQAQLGARQDLINAQMRMWQSSLQGAQHRNEMMRQRAAAELASESGTVPLIKRTVKKAGPPAAKGAKKLSTVDKWVKKFDPLLKKFGL